MKNFRRYFTLMELGKLKVYELVFTFLIYAFPLFVAKIITKNGILPFFSETKNYIMLPLITLLLLNCWLLFKKLKHKRDNPEFYRGYLLAMMICLMGLSIWLATDLLIGGVSLVIAFFAFLFSTGIVLSYIYNCMYIFVLKKMFPKQSNETKKGEFIKLHFLSEFMDLNTQKVYLSLLLLDLFLYFVFCGFTMMILLKHIDIQGIYIMSNLSNWAKELGNVFMVFNAIGLLSLILTVYSITFPKRKKIITDAKNKLNQRFNNI